VLRNRSEERNAQHCEIEEEVHDRLNPLLLESPPRVRRVLGARLDAQERRQFALHLGLHNRRVVERSVASFSADIACQTAGPVVEDF